MTPTLAHHPRLPSCSSKSTMSSASCSRTYEEVSFSCPMDIFRVFITIGLVTHTYACFLSFHVNRSTLSRTAARSLTLCSTRLVSTHDKQTKRQRYNELETRFLHPSLAWASHVSIGTNTRSYLVQLTQPILSRAQSSSGRALLVSADRCIGRTWRCAFLSAWALSSCWSSSSVMLSFFWLVHVLLIWN